MVQTKVHSVGIGIVFGCFLRVLLSAVSVLLVIFGSEVRSSLFRKPIFFKLLKNSSELFDTFRYVILCYLLFLFSFKWKLE